METPQEEGSILKDEKPATPKADSAKTAAAADAIEPDDVWLTIAEYATNIND